MGEENVGGEDLGKETKGSEQDAARAVEDFLSALGVDVSAQGMDETPQRVAKMYAFLFSGIGIDPCTLWGETFDTKAQGLVAVRHIPFYSMCEHHLVPFFGAVSIAYLPRDGCVAGFGKFADVVACLSHRPQLQERLTAEIADAVMEGLHARGVLVICSAQQLCMTMRSALAHGTQTVTSECRGALAEGAALSAQAWQLLGK